MSLPVFDNHDPRIAYHHLLFVRDARDLPRFPAQRDAQGRGLAKPLISAALQKSAEEQDVLP